MPLFAEMRERMAHKNGHAEKVREHHRMHMPDFSKMAERMPDLNELSERVPAIERMREEMPEWAEVRDRMTGPPASTSVAYSLIGTGLGLGAILAFTRRRGLLMWAMPAVLLAAGLALVSGGYVHRRGERIDETMSRIREELAELDPIARARVVASMATENVGPLIRRFQQQ